MCERKREKDREKKERKRECGRKEEKDGKEKEKEKRRRETEKEGEGEERRERERVGENRKGDTKNVFPSPDVFPSTKLGNNTTLMKRRLGKNKTPTGRRSIGTETESPGGSPAKKTKPWRFITCRFQLRPKKEGDSEYGLHSKGAAIYKKAKALEKSRNRFQFSINQH